MTVTAATSATSLAASAGLNVMHALAHAAERTGADFDYLLATAKRESGLNPLAKSKSSSATGLFQFIEQTWLATVKSHGAKHGLAREAALIERDAKGRYSVATSSDKQAILALRRDPKIAALMAGELTEDSEAKLEQRLGREVNGTDLYLAHFFGAAGATKFLKAADENAGASAAGLFPAAAAANRSVFFAPDGSARSLAEVRGHLAKLHGGVAETVRAPVTRDMADSSGDESADLIEVIAERIDPAGAGGLFSLPEAAMRLTPQVLALLASLDPIPGDTLRGRKVYGAF